MAVPATGPAEAASPGANKSVARVKLEVSKASKWRPRKSNSANLFKKPEPKQPTRKLDMGAFERVAKRQEARRFADVPEPLWPCRWSLEVKEKLKTVWAPIQLPHVMFPSGAIPLPPTLEWGYPLTLQEVIELGRRGHPQSPSSADDLHTRQHGARYLTAAVGCTVRLRATLNAPHPGGIVASLADNYDLLGRWERKEVGKKHVGRLSKALGRTDGLGPRWYVNATQPNWRYDVYER